MCAPTGRPGPPAAASIPAAPQVERGGWARSPARGGRAHPAREPSGQRRPARGPSAGERARGGEKPGSECGLRRPALHPWSSHAALSGGTESPREASPPAALAPGPGGGAAGERGGERPSEGRLRGMRGVPPGPLGMLRLWTADKGEGLSRWRDGLGRIREAGKVGPKRSLSGIRNLRPLPLSGVLVSLPLLQMGNIESQWEHWCAWARLWLGGPVAESTPLRARGVPWPQFPHLTPAGRSSHLLVRLS